MIFDKMRIYLTKFTSSHGLYAKLGQIPYLNQTLEFDSKQIRFFVTKTSLFNKESETSI
jgi:hypothetical protein